ncbi:hypothetical protein [Azospirillum palustre]
MAAGKAAVHTTITDMGLSSSFGIVTLAIIIVIISRGVV